LLNSWTQLDVTSDLSMSQVKTHSQKTCWQIISLSHQSGHLTDLKSVDCLIWGAAQQLVLLSDVHGHWPYETRYKQLLWRDHSVPKNYSCSVIKRFLLVVRLTVHFGHICKSYFCHYFALKLSPILIFWVVTCCKVKRTNEVFIFRYFVLISEHFGKHCMILLLTVENEDAVNCIRFFLDHPE